MVKSIVLGVISDTHGQLRREALQALRGSDRILHAGDVGDRKILEALALIAPVTAVRGNVDTAPWTRALAETEVVEAHLSDEALVKLRRGGHDPKKVYNAYHAAISTKDKPTVILAHTIKGYGLGEAGEGRN